MSVEPGASRASRWPLSAAIAIIGIGSAAVIAFLALGAVILARAAPLPPEGPESVLSAGEPSEHSSPRPTSKPHRTEPSTDAAPPSPEATQPRVDIAAADDIPDGVAPLHPHSTSSQPSPASSAPPALPACPSGEVTITPPTFAEVSVDPMTAETLTNLGMSDLLDPDEKTNNRLVYRGRVINNTTSTIAMPNAPGVVSTGVNEGKAHGSFDGSSNLAPGASVSWSATGSGTFPRADVTGYALNLLWVDAFWSDDAPCPRPVLVEG